MTQQEQINQTLALYQSVMFTLSRTARLRKFLGSLVLALSVLTSGSLWLLLSEAVPRSTLWFGAIASTLASGITVYIYWSGILQAIGKSLSLYADVGQFLAKVRAAPVPDDEYWSKFKDFEYKLEKIKVGQSIQDI